MNQKPKQSSSNLTGTGMAISFKAKKEPRRVRNGILILLVFFIFFTPFRTSFVVIGIDRTPEGSDAGRSDTMILATMPPVLPRVSLLSIPRDLWVNIPGYGENRINTAHYFAELDNPGTGMQAASDVIETNFGVSVPYVIRLKFDGFVKIVDAMGGVTVDLPEPMSGLEAGRNHLDGTAALKFVRDRASSDDFFRQKRGQLFLSATIKSLLNPIKWLRIPVILTAGVQSIDTNIPFWLWPRIIYGATFSAIKGFDSNTISREMVTSWTTDQGAQVLLPNWDMINPLVTQVFR